LLVASLVPTACVLWFMTEAMRNEHLAVRQKLTAVYHNQLAAIGRRLDAFWQAKQSALAAVDPGATAGEIFDHLVRSGVADSVLVYDALGRLRYPSAARAPNRDETAETAEWRSARLLEFERADYAAAASAYARIAREAADDGTAARALQAQARCLLKAGQKQAALAILTSTLADARYADATDAQGSLIVPNAQLLVLQLLGNPADAAYRTTLALLVQRLTDYRDASLSAGQRRFLMEQVRARAPDAPEFATLGAETLAADYLDVAPPPAPGSALQPSGLRGVWRLASSDQTVVALFREARIGSEMQALIDSELAIPEVAIALVPPGKEPPEPAPLLTVAAGTSLPSWQLALSLQGPDPFAVAAGRQVAVYLWTGVTVVVVFGLLAGLVTRTVGVQLRLTRLRNDLLATVSHELKTPLSSIRALVETLLEGRYRDPQQRREYLQLIAQENERLSRLMDNFLAFSRLERNQRVFEFADVHLETIVRAALDAEQERLAAPGCRVEVAIASDLPPVSGDADALTTVLINLLDNAYKYTGPDKQIGVRVSAADGHVRLEVTDNGIGLSRRAATKVFDRFYQVDQSLSRKAGGCGLGLSIVRFLVTAHGGSVTVASQSGVGSTFTVVLPVKRNHRGTKTQRRPEPR
jgi:signal transduction histidine kinase